MSFMILESKMQMALQLCECSWSSQGLPECTSICHPFFYMVRLHHCGTVSVVYHSHRELKASLYLNRLCQVASVSIHLGLLWFYQCYREHTFNLLPLSLSLIPQHYNLIFFISTWATKSCSGLCHVRNFTYLSVANKKQIKLWMAWQKYK